MTVGFAVAGGGDVLVAVAVGALGVAVGAAAVGVGEGGGTVGVAVGGAGVGVNVGGGGGGPIGVGAVGGGGGGVLDAANPELLGECIATPTASIPAVRGNARPIDKRLFIQDSLRLSLRSGRLVAA